jgi:hypothetical protein
MIAHVRVIAHGGGDRGGEIGGRRSGDDRAEARSLAPGR